MRKKKRRMAEILIISLLLTCVIITNFNMAKAATGHFSTWSETVPPQGAKQVETKCEYSHRDKSYTTSPSSYLEGWSLYRVTSQWGEWGGWGVWGPDWIASSDSVGVESRTAWRFYSFTCHNCGTHDPYSGPCSNCDGSMYWEVLWLPYSGYGTNYYGAGSAKGYIWCNGCKWYFEYNGASNGEGGTGQPTRTEYRSRSRNLISLL